MQKELLAAVVTILIVAGGVVGYLYGLNFTTERTATEVRTSTVTTPSTSVITSTSTLVVPSTIVSTSTKVVNFTQTVLTVPYASNETQVCITNIKNPPQKQYVSLLLLIVKNPIFVQYSDGRCWAWNSTFELMSGGSSSTNFVFDHYSDQIYYSCWLYPAHRIDTEIYVVPTIVNGTVAGLTIKYEGQGSGVGSCPPSVPAVVPISFKLVSWNSTGQTVALTVQLTSNLSVSSLTTRLYNSTWDYTLDFSQVTQTHPLAPGSRITQVAFMAASPLRGEFIYNMTLSGTYTNGTSLSANVYVELQT